MAIKTGRAALMKAILVQDRSAVLHIGKAMDIAGSPWLAASCFQAAIANSKTASVQALADAGASLEAKDALGQSPVCWACRHGEAAALRILLAAGADPDGKDARGTPPLFLCAESDKALECALVLLERGADAMALDENGKTLAERARICGEGGRNGKVGELLACAWEAAVLGREAAAGARAGSKLGGL